MNWWKKAPSVPAAGEQARGGPAGAEGHAEAVRAEAARLWDEIARETGHRAGPGEAE